MPLTPLRLPDPTRLESRADVPLERNVLAPIRAFLNEFTRALSLFLSDLASTVDFNTPRKGEVTLTPSATSTIVYDRLCTAKSVVFLQPTTTNAGFDWASGAFYWITSDESFTISHSSDPATDRTFNYVLFQ